MCASYLSALKWREELRERHPEQGAEPTGRQTMGHPSGQRGGTPAMIFAKTLLLVICPCVDFPFKIPPGGSILMLKR